MGGEEVVLIVNDRDLRADPRRMFSIGTASDEANPRKIRRTPARDQSPAAD
jgi:hypothetical protein